MSIRVLTPRALISNCGKALVREVSPTLLTGRLSRYNGHCATFADKREVQRFPSEPPTTAARNPNLDKPMRIIRTCVIKRRAIVSLVTELSFRPIRQVSSSLPDGFKKTFLPFKLIADFAHPEPRPATSRVGRCRIALNIAALSY